MSLLTQYRVIANRNVTISEGGSSVTHPPNSVFSASPRNSDVLRNLQLGYIAQTTGAQSNNPQPISLNITNIGLPPLSGILGSVLTETPVGTASWQPLNLSAFTTQLINTFQGPIDAEVSQSYISPSFTASYNAVPVTASVIDDQGNGATNVSGSPTAFTAPYTYFKTVYGATVTWTLTAANASISGAKTYTTNWFQRVYYGVGTSGQTTAAFIISLPSNVQGTRVKTFTVAPTAIQKIYYAHRTGYGTADLAVNGFIGGFTIVSTAINVTNGFGFVEPYTLYESDNLGLGTTTVVVT